MCRIPAVFVCVVLGAGVATGSQAGAANSPVYSLERPSSIVPMPAGLPAGEWALAQWQNGLLVMQTADEITKEGVTNLIGADRSGKIVFQHTVWLAGAAKVLMIGTAVSKEHLVAVSGFASFPSAPDINFVREIRPDGSLLRMIDTSRFSAFSLAYDGQGDLWIAGSQNMEQDKWPEHNVLRRYRDGRLQGEFLPYSDFLPRYEPGTKSTTHPAMHGNGSRAFLLPLRQGVGLWSPGSHEWIEVGSDGTVLGRWQARLPQPSETPLAAQTNSPAPRMTLYGLAVTSSGEVVASIQERNVRHRIYRLDKASSSWQEIAVSADIPESVSYVAGADGESVVYKVKSNPSGWAISSLVQK